MSQRPPTKHRFLRGEGVLFNQTIMKMMRSFLRSRRSKSLDLKFCLQSDTHPRATDILTSTPRHQLVSKLSSSLPFRPIAGPAISIIVSEEDTVGPLAQFLVGTVGVKIISYSRKVPRHVGFGHSVVVANP